MPVSGSCLSRFVRWLPVRPRRLELHCFQLYLNTSPRADDSATGDQVLPVPRASLWFYPSLPGHRISWPQRDFTASAAGIPFAPVKGSRGGDLHRVGLATIAPASPAWKVPASATSPWARPAPNGGFTGDVGWRGGFSFRGRAVSIAQRWKIAEEQLRSPPWRKCSGASQSFYIWRSS